MDAILKFLNRAFGAKFENRYKLFFLLLFTKLILFEQEHHLQRAIVAGLIIPTPEVFQVDDVGYFSRCYPCDWKVPRNLIHMQRIFHIEFTKVTPISLVVFFLQLSVHDGARHSRLRHGF